MERTGDILITLNNKTLIIKKSNLYRFKFFRVQFEDDDLLNKFTIPDNTFIQQIEDLLLEADDKLKIHKLYDVSKNIKYIQASLYLGINYKRFLDDVNLYDGLFNTAIRNIQYFADAGLLKLIVPQYQKFLTPMPIYNKSPQLIQPWDINEENKNLISKIVPYFTSFDRAFVVCDIGDIDFNLIIAKPTLKDLFIYQKTKNNFSTYYMCKIFRECKDIADRFLRQFDHITIHYGYDINHERVKPRKYPSFKQNYFFIRLIVDGGKDWYSREELNIRDCAINKMGDDIKIDNPIILYTDGNCPSDNLPMGDDIYEHNDFSFRRSDGFKFSYLEIMNAEPYDYSGPSRDFPV